VSLTQFDAARAVFHWAKYRPDTLAISSDAGQLSYAQLAAKIGAVATSLQAPNSAGRVAVLSHGKTELLVNVLAAVASRRCVVILNPLLPLDSLCTNVEDARAAFMIAGQHEHAESLFEQVRNQSALQALKPASTREWGVLFSSGSTGTPKGIERDCESIAVEMVGWCLELGLSRRTKFYIGRPVFYTGGLVLALSIFLVGGSVIFQEDNQIGPELTWDHYQSNAETIDLDFAFFIPDQLRSFLRMARATPPRGKSRTILTMGAPISGAEKLAVRSILGSDVIESWGNTESLGTITDSEDLDTRPNSIGRPFLGDRLLVVDEHNKPLPPNQIGRLAGGQEAGFTEYSGRPEATRLALAGDLIVSEDLGSVDDSGYFYILGRVQDAVILQGRTVLLSMIEVDIRTLHGLDDAVVHARKLGPGTVELICLAVAKPQIRQALAPRIEKFLQIPGAEAARVLWVEALPRTPSGKIDRISVGRSVES